MSLNIGNCPRCGRVFAKGTKEVCPSCIKLVDEEYAECAQYLRENRGASIHQVSEDTGVSVKQITKFIREGRISLSDAPNLGYPCDSCGAPIRESNICESCRKRLTSDVDKLREREQRRMDEIRKASQSNQASYKIHDPNKK
jgi:flagellar operon protein (TIGR03826 family)